MEWVVDCTHLEAKATHRAKLNILSWACWGVGGSEYMLNNNLIYHRWFTVEWEGRKQGEKITKLDVSLCLLFLGPVTFMKPLVGLGRLFAL